MRNQEFPNFVWVTLVNSDDSGSGNEGELTHLSSLRKSAKALVPIALAYVGFFQKHSVADFFYLICHREQGRVVGCGYDADALLDYHVFE